MMKVLFLCGSLEVGKDGVGDYTRRLGLELVKQGHEVKVVALNDNLSAEHREHLEVNAKELELIQFPSSLTWDNRIDKLDRLLNNFKPDWISLQYVPYSFQKRGISYQFAKSLKRIDKNWQWHIMFHETWLGISGLSPLKHKIIGFFQRKVAQLLLQCLKPKRISTSNKLYQMVLAKANIQASIIPLFSNIPLVTAESRFQTELFQQLKITALDRNKYSVLGIFGRLHKGYDFEKVINEELNTARAAQKELVFISFGRIGDLEEVNRLKSLFKSSVRFCLLGELSEEEVSVALQVLDLGISCTPLEHIGKSGVYAAMRHHNVKVLLPFSDEIPEFEIEIKKYNDYLHSRPLHKWGVEYVALKFVKLLDNK